MAHLVSQLAHLGVATRIIGYRTVCIGGQRDAEGGEHAHRRDADAIQSGLYAVCAHAHIKAVGT